MVIRESEDQSQVAAEHLDYQKMLNGIRERLADIKDRVETLDRMIVVAADKIEEAHSPPFLGMTQEMVDASLQRLKSESDQEKLKRAARSSKAI